MSHLIHLITLFKAIPIDCYLDQVSILYGCWDIVAQSMHTFCYFVLYIYILYILSRTPFYQFHKEHPKKLIFDYPSLKKLSLNLFEIFTAF